VPLAQMVSVGTAPLLLTRADLDQAKLPIAVAARERAG